MKPICKTFLLSIFALSLLACGSDSSSNASEESSSSEEELSSSSSYSNRLDVTYADTLTSDTLILSGKSDTASYKLFLGEYPKGTKIDLYVRKISKGGSDSIFVREEQGTPLVPEIFTVEAGDTTYNTQNNFVRMDSAEFSTARFVTTAESGFYYVDIPRITVGKDSAFKISIAAEIAQGYYAYTGEADSATITLGDTLRGVFVLGNTADSALFTFTATVGKSINVNATGKSISKIEMHRNGKVEVSGTSLDEQLLPEAKATYSVIVYPKRAPDYTTGPYAYFEIQTSSRDLEKGEYFANPDSIKMFGDTLVIVREKNDAAKYYLRQEQYVYLGTLQKNDSIQISHEIEGYYSGAAYPATYTVLDSAGDSVASITETRNLFKAPKAGPYYLHYVRLNSPPNTQSQILTLKTMVQRFDYVTRFFFFDEEREEALTSKNVSIGDTLYFSKLALRAEPSDASASAIWYVPCTDLRFISSAYTESSCKSYGTEQLIGATNISISDDSNNAGEIIRLIAQSIADPHSRDTLELFITDSDSP